MIIDFLDLECYTTGDKEINERLTDARLQLSHFYLGSDNNIQDMVYEVANECVPIYNCDILAATPYLEEYFNECFYEGLFSTNDKDFSLVRAL